MKEEAFLRRRFSLCPPSSTPQKVDPRKLSRNLLLATAWAGFLPRPGHPCRCPCLACHTLGSGGGAARQPCPGPHAGHSLAGKDMEPNSPSPPRDEGPPTPGSATKVPPVGARLWEDPRQGACPGDDGKWLEGGDSRAAGRTHRCQPLALNQGGCWSRGRSHRACELFIKAIFLSNTGRGCRARRRLGLPGGLRDRKSW
ncbi:hypothetical protein DBR06_SOUSAS6910288 [Sousa chinensis]|nr:hypothetical protein DBR06_SOUSAS6910288 [Sousa chinensis]